MADARIETLVILGAGGDLTSRLLLPGLASLLASSRGEKLQLIGVDRDEMTDAAWRSRVRAAFAAFRSDLGERVARDSFYLQADATSADDLAAVLTASTGRTAVYFALPPAITRQGVHDPVEDGAAARHRAGAREAVRRRRAQRPIAQPAAADDGARGAGVPGRPLPRQVDDPQPDRTAVREPHLRAAAVGRERRAASRSSSRSRSASRAAPATTTRRARWST